MNATLNSILADLNAIGLDELNKRAAMLTRVDRKYALDAATASSILSHLPEDVLVLNKMCIRDRHHTPRHKLPD